MNDSRFSDDWIIVHVRSPELEEYLLPSEGVVVPAEMRVAVELVGEAVDLTRLCFQ